MKKVTTNRKSFLLYTDSLDVLDKLDNDTIAELFIAFRDYNKGLEIKLSKMGDIIFSQFKNQFDREGIKYDNICERNRINGLAGGRPSNPVNPVGSLGKSGNPNKPKKAHTDPYTDPYTDPGSKNNTKRTLKDLSILDIKDWLEEKRATGKYLQTDEYAVLEKFKGYCLANGKEYADYVAAYKNAFEWYAPKEASSGILASGRNETPEQRRHRLAFIKKDIDDIEQEQQPTERG